MYHRTAKQLTLRTNKYIVSGVKHSIGADGQPHQSFLLFFSLVDFDPTTTADSQTLSSFIHARPMASLAPNISSDKATSIDHSHTIMTRNYERDDWRILTLNDATEDALSKILRFGFDIDRVTTKPPTANPIKAQLLAWAAHIASEIPGYNNWQEIYDFTFAALNAPDAVPGEDSTHIGTGVAELGGFSRSQHIQ